MITQHSKSKDPTNAWSDDGGGRRGHGAGALLVATLVGVGVGLLAAPQPGTKTRKLLLKRLAALSEGMGESMEDVQDVSSKAGSGQAAAGEMREAQERIGRCGRSLKRPSTGSAT